MSESLPAVIARDDRPAAYVEDGVAIYRASAVGLCEEALVALRMGVQPTMPPEWMLEKYEEGAEWEDHIVQGACEVEGLTLVTQQEQARVDITPTIAIRGATDGRGIKVQGGQQVGIEAKKLGPRLFSNWERGLDYFWTQSPYYRDQLTVYMHAHGMPYVYAVGEWDPDEKVVRHVHTQLIVEPPGDINEIRKKILRVEGRARKGDLGHCDGTHSFPCPVWFLHEAKEREAVTGDQGEAIERLGRAYHEAQQMESAGKKLKDQVKAELRAVLAEFGFVDEEAGQISEPAEVNGVRVTPYWHSYTRLDKKAAEEDGVDLGKYEVRNQSLAVRVSVKD